MSASTEMEKLKAKIIELENLLERQNNESMKTRTKIKEMSSEVVDSNPYRYAYLFVL